MLKVLALIATLMGVATAASDADWMVFKAKHGKVYSREEDYFRRMIFEENLQRIRSHNELFAKGLASFYLGHNKHMDRSNDEFVKSMNGYTITNKLNSLISLRNDDVQFFKFNNSSAEPLPSEIDWRKKGYVTPVKDQGQCGSCWAFSTTGSLEGAHFKATGTLVSLSEQNLMDCSWSYGNEGCNGGLMVKAFRYIIANKGINTEESYPYTEKDSRDCKFRRENVGATMSKYTVIAEGSETQLQEAVATIGPVSVAIDASNLSFQFYEGGVYKEADCSSTKLDHGVLVVGYGTDNGQDYWLVKNSWGSYWGQDGYIKMSRNRNNQCGIATSASYPIV